MALYHVAVFVDNIDAAPLAAGFGWGGAARAIDGQPALAPGETVKIFGHARRPASANPGGVALC